jgi:hypothetical protein
MPMLYIFIFHSLLTYIEFVVVWSLHSNFYFITTTPSHDVRILTVTLWVKLICFGIQFIVVFLFMPVQHPSTSWIILTFISTRRAVLLDFRPVLPNWVSFSQVVVSVFCLDAPPYILSTTHFLLSTKLIGLKAVRRAK